jgi:hypothetical protein
MDRTPEAPVTFSTSGLPAASADTLTLAVFLGAAGHAPVGPTCHLRHPLRR